jgi:hypothetical protein
MAPSRAARARLSGYLLTGALCLLPSIAADRRRSISWRRLSCVLNWTTSRHHSLPPLGMFFLGHPMNAPTGISGSTEHAAKQMAPRRCAGSLRLRNASQGSSSPRGGIGPIRLKSHSNGFGWSNPEMGFALCRCRFIAKETTNSLKAFSLAVSSPCSAASNADCLSHSHMSRRAASRIVAQAWGSGPPSSGPGQSQCFSPRRSGDMTVRSGSSCHSASKTLGVSGQLP